MRPLPAAQIRSFQLDLARHPEEPDEVLRLARLAAGWGCTHVVLYLEGTIASPACPEPAATRIFSEAEVQRMAAGIAEAGLALVPVLPCLAHAEHFVRSPGWRHLAEDAAGVGRFGVLAQPRTLCPSHRETVPLLAAHLRHVCALLPGADLHLGLDEAFQLGVCPHCAARGDLARIWIAHLHALVAALAPLGRRLWLWDDALELFPELLDELPRGLLLCHWQYDAQIDSSGIQGRLVNRWRRDWLALYRERGFEVLACPWLKVPANVQQLSAYAQGHPGTGLLLTSWDATHRLLPALGLVARSALRSWRGEDAEQAWQATAQEIAGEAGPLLAALGALVAPTPLHSEASLLGGTISPEEDAQERLLTVLEPQLERLLPGDSAEGCDGRLLAWWTRWRLAQLGLRRYLPGLADPTLNRARRTQQAAAARRIGRRLQALVDQLPTVFHDWSDGGDDRACLARLRADLGSQLALAERLAVAPPLALLVLRLRHQDCYGVPQLAVDSDATDGSWQRVASGCWKPQADGSQLSSGHFTHAFPLDHVPTRLRLHGGGLGGGGVAFVEVRCADGVLLPSAILAHAGAVQHPEALLRDDSSVCRFGSWDIAAPMRLAPQPLPSGQVELALGRPAIHAIEAP